MQFNFNPEKFKALVHYVCSTCYDVSKLNATKLHKILWLSDILAYKNMGEPISCEVYKKNTFGPYSTHLKDILSQLEKEQKIHINKLEWGKGKTKYEYHSKAEPDKSLFTKNQLRLIDDMRDYVCEGTAGTISQLTHDTLWEMALMHETIPYEAVLVTELARVNKEDIEWAQSEISKVSE